MTILDLRRKGNPANGEQKLFHSLSVQKLNEFHKELYSIFPDHKVYLDWWSSSPASRNTIASPLFYHFCTIKLVDELIKTKKLINYKKILVDSNALKRIIEKKVHQYYNNIPVVNVTSYFRNNIFMLVKLYLKVTHEFIKRSYQLFCARRTQHLCTELCEDNIILIEKYIFPGFVSKERYYNGLWENLDTKQKSITYFVPSIVMTQTTNMLNTYKELRLSKKNYLIKEDYILFRDLLFAIGHIWRLSKIIINKKNNDFASLFHEELKNANNFSSAVESLLNYRFVKSMKERKVKLGLVISWFENQDVDKGWNFGFNTFYPDVRSMGYRGLVPAKLYLSQMYPTDFEQKNKVLPQVVCVTGKGFIESSKTYAPNLNVEEAPAFRFQHLWNGGPHAPVKENYTILIALPITLNDSIHIIEQMILCTNELSIESLHLWIRLHPTMSANKLKRDFGSIWPKSFEFIDSDTQTVLRKADILVSGMSSICLEAMALGVPVLLVEQPWGLQYNPIPDKLEQDLWKKCSSSQDILVGIEHYRKRNEEELTKHHQLGLQIRKTYFEPVTREGVLKFLGIKGDSTVAES